MQDVYRLAARALASGGQRVSVSTIVWHVEGVCTDPFCTTYWGRPSAPTVAEARRRGYRFYSEDRGNFGHVKHMTVNAMSGDIPMFVDIYTACHKCEACLEHRASLWRMRATQETKDSVRTWFGTLTLSPDEAFLALSRARAREGTASYDALPPEKRFILWDAQIWPQVKLYLKRVRSEGLRKAGFPTDGGWKPYRYLLVTERHESGVPHYHALVHEVHPAIPVRKATLDRQWTLGEIRQWRLVSDVRPASYVAKYLSSDIAARVRASQNYGEARSTTTDIHL